MSGLDEFLPKKFEYKHHSERPTPPHDILKCSCHRGSKTWFVTWTFQNKRFDVNQYANETMEFWK